MNGLSFSRALVILGLFSLVAACGSDDTDVQTQRSAIGEPVENAPSWSERAVLYLTNRARTEPTAFNAADPYAPTPPLRWDYNLTLAARFHAEHIDTDNCWCEDHSSCCELTNVGGEVSCIAPPTMCGLTDAATRVALFSPAYTGENMARGYPTPMAVVDGWISSPGHWQNINGSGHRTLGVGQFGTAWVQDFGSGAAAPVISDGIHLPEGAATRFGITYYQPGTGGPQAAMVIVEGQCIDLDLAYGESAAHAAYEISTTLESGCHRYYFFVRDGNGNDFTYPSRGSLGVSTGASTENCPLYLEERPADTCSPVGQSCSTGDSRACYTGPFGTRDEGECMSGVERCIAGSWTGECLDETFPVIEICANQLDDDCDGEVDEECGSNEDAGPDASSTPDMGTGASDTDFEAQPSDAKSASGAEGCAVSQPHNIRVSWHLLLASLLAMIFAIRRPEF